MQGGIDAASWVPLGLVIGAGSLTLLYMTRTWALLFQRSADDDTAALKQPGEGDSYLAPLMLIGICLFFGLYAAPLIDVATATVDQVLCNPDVCEFSPYIEAVLGS